MNKIWLVIPLLFLSSLVAAQNYVPVDAGSKFRFSIKNFGISTGGDFTGASGAISFNPAKPDDGSFFVELNAASVNTANGTRDKHLRGKDYFNVTAYPKLSFKSTKVSNSSKAGYFYIFGILTIKGVSKEVSFPFTATPENGGMRFNGSFTINRRDFKVGGNSISLSDNLNVTLSVFAKKS